MKKLVTTLTFLFVLLFAAVPVKATEVQVQPKEQVTITFDANGGTGTMTQLVLTDLSASKTLTPNAFIRTNYTFVGWNDEADGDGDDYADGADATDLLDDIEDNEQVTLYAQWKMTAVPTKVKTKTVSKSYIKVSYAKMDGVKGYEIACSTNKKFKAKYTATLEVKKKVNSVIINKTIPGKQHYIRVRAFYNENGQKKYTDWSVVKKHKIKKKVPTASNTKCSTAIEADVTLTGKGSGCHAKLVLGTATSAVSFGLQYDKHAIAPFTGKTTALIENVASNDAGGQTYTRPGSKFLKLGKKYHMMITVDKKGKGSVYLDYKKIGSFKNSQLANTAVYPWVEGSARLNGDSVTATFENVNMRRAGEFRMDKNYPVTRRQSTCKTIKTKVKSDGTVIISGKVTGLPAGKDWDSAYDKVSGVVGY